MTACDRKGFDGINVTNKYFCAEIIIYYKMTYLEIVPCKISMFCSTHSYVRVNVNANFLILMLMLIVILLIIYKAHNLIVLRSWRNHGYVDRFSI